MSSSRPGLIVGTAIGSACLAVALGSAAVASQGIKTPASFRIDRVGATSVTLKWDERSTESSFQLTANVGGTESILTIPKNKESFKHTGLPRGTAVSYSLRACDDAGGCSAPTPVRRMATLIAPFFSPYPSLGDCQVFPDPPASVGNDSPGIEDNSAWNQDISNSPVDPNSKRIIKFINSHGGSEFHPDFGTPRNFGFPYVVVGSSQPNVRVKIGPNGFPDESDFGRAPIPPRAPNEGGSTDAHVIVVDRDACELFELYVAHYKGGVGNRWRADSTARFDLTSTKLREDGFTSADAAGLPIFPGLTLYDEVASGEIDHALRITFDVTRRAYLNPATHYASKVCNSAAPAMGLRLRLRANYPEGGLGPQSKVIVKALKTYGVINADNGRNWFLSGASDKRWDHDDLGTLKKIDGIDFEVVRSADKHHTDC